MTVQTVRITIGNHTKAIRSRKRFRLIARTALKQLRDSSPTLVDTSWDEEVMERKHRAIVRDIYAELHTRGDWERTE